MSDLGDSAVAGCVANYCELAVLGGGVWLKLSTVDSEHTGIEQLTELAHAALASVTG